MEQLPQSARPESTGPKKRWHVLLAWAGCLAGILAAQRIAADISPSGYLMIDGSGPPLTLAERLWYWLSPAMVLVFSVFFFLAAKRLVPEDGTRSAIRAWGVLLTFVALLVSYGMVCWFYLMWYTD